MKKLAFTVTTKIYDYDTKKELEKHKEQMEVHGYLRMDFFRNSNGYTASYEKEINEIRKKYCEECHSVMLKRDLRFSKKYCEDCLSDIE